MALHSRYTTAALQVGGVLAILGLAVTAFLLLPAELVFNDYVGGAIFGATILLLGAFVRLTHPDAEHARLTGQDR